MAKNEQTSKRVASIAAKALQTGKATPSQIRSMAGAALTQAPDRSHKKK